jgi:hypothetical protein
MDPKEHRRREERYRVIKAAKLIFGNSEIGCIVVNISKSGACIKTLAEVAVPEHVILKFPHDGSFRAHRVWSKGQEFGFSLNGLAPLSRQDQLLAISALNALSMSAPHTPISILRDAGFFDDPALAAAADEVEAAYGRLFEQLQSRIALKSIIPNA